MTVPYNLLPIEAHLAMITAQQPSAQVLTDAAQMWTEVREWIEAARTELNSRAATLTQGWTDDAGRTLETKFQRTLAELKMWGERIDASQVVSNLTTLAGAIPEALQEVTGLYQTYLALLSNPFTAPAAAGCQVLSGARMTALGAHFDTSMLTVCAAAGVSSPADLVPGLKDVQGPSASDLAKSAEAATSALSALQSLGSSLTGGGSTPDLSALTSGLTGDGGGAAGSLPDLSGLGGPSLAAAAPTATLPDLTSLGGVGGAGLSGGGVPPVPSTALGGFGTLGAANGLPSLVRPGTVKKAPALAGEVEPGTATSGGGVSGGGGVMPPMAGQGTPGTLRPRAAGQPSATGRSGSGRRASTESDGVAPTLRGRAGSGDHTSFTLPRGRAAAETDTGSVQLLDEELWQV